MSKTTVCAAAEKLVPFANDYDFSQSCMGLFVFVQQSDSFTMQVSNLWKILLKNTTKSEPEKERSRDLR